MNLIIIRFQPSLCYARLHCVTGTSRDKLRGVQFEMGSNLNVYFKYEIVLAKGIIIK